MRRSPVDLPASAAATESRDGWTVVLRYEGEERHGGPWLVDLSHRCRWDYQDADIVAQTPMDLPVPRQSGQVGVHGPFVINRMNRTQAAIWHLGSGSPPETHRATGLTETTDGHCMLAFAGAGVGDVLEYLTALDLLDPGRRMPFLTQGPVLRVPCQVVTFAPDLVVMTCARGYGATLADALLKTRAPARLAPGGEEVFGRFFPGASG